MAEAPARTDELVDRYSPHLNFTPPGASAQSAKDAPDTLVKTHCSFCGMQCGIQLKVRDNKLVGFEPWEEFPFNKGTLCPKGVKRYLQGSHPDRLLHSLKRTPSGFEEIS